MSLSFGTFSDFGEAEGIRQLTYAQLADSIPQVQRWDGTRFQAQHKLEDALRNQGQVFLMVDTEATQEGFGRVAVKQMPNNWVCKNYEQFLLIHPEAREKP